MDEHGNPLNSEEGYYNYEYTYDANNNVTIKTVLYGDGTQAKYFSEYNADNQLVKTYTDLNADVWVTYKYANDLLVEQIYNNTHGVVRVTNEYRYDEYGNMTASIEYKNDGETVQKEKRWEFFYG